MKNECVDMLALLEWNAERKGIFVLFKPSLLNIALNIHLAVEVEVFIYLLSYFLKIFSKDIALFFIPTIPYYP